MRYFSYLDIEKWSKIFLFMFTVLQEHSWQATEPDNVFPHHAGWHPGYSLPHHRSVSHKMNGTYWWMILSQARWSGRSWTAGSRAGCSASCSSSSRHSPSPPPTTWSSPSPWRDTEPSPSHSQWPAPPTGRQTNDYWQTLRHEKHWWLSILVCEWDLFPQRLENKRKFLGGRTVVIIPTDGALKNSISHLQVYSDRLDRGPGPLGAQPVHLHHHGGGPGSGVRVGLQGVELHRQEGIFQRSVPRHLRDSTGQCSLQCLCRHKRISWPKA